MGGLSPGRRIGEVLGATQQAVCARAIQRFKVSKENQSQIEVRRIKSEDGRKPAEKLG